MVSAMLKTNFPSWGCHVGIHWLHRDIVIACCVIDNPIVMYGARDELLQKIRMTPPNALKIDPQLRVARDWAIVPRWTGDTWTAFWDTIAEQMWADYELQLEEEMA